MNKTGVDSVMLRKLMGPVIGYDYVFDRPSDNPVLLVQHRVQMLIKGGGTKRFHTVRTLTDNTVAEHSWGVAAFMWVMSAGQCSAEAMMAALTHDVAEHFVGDVPSPTKRALNMGDALNEVEDTVLNTAGFLFDITIEEARWLKLADYFDGMMFCIRERSLGNVGVRKVWENFSRYLVELEPTGLEVEIFHSLNNAWQKVDL